MIVVIPMTGLIHVHTDGSVPWDRPFRRASVRVNLSRDNDHVGTVTFNRASTEKNERATEATYLLSGAYLLVNGTAEFEVPDEHEDLMYQVVAEL